MSGRRKLKSYQFLPKVKKHLKKRLKPGTSTSTTEIKLTTARKMKRRGLSQKK